jgi:2-C-methyl-D-erythritol 4-phosphate cytidylyltransferase
MTMKNGSRYAIVVAGGRGRRYGGSIPKQLLPLAQKPVLLHAMERLAAFDPQLELVVVLPHGEVESWLRAVEKFFCVPAHCLVEGGATRFHSVLNALQVLTGSGLVAVHDGVRPLVSLATIGRCFAAAERDGAAIPVVPLSSSIRRILPDGASETANRTEFCVVQTPQVFSLEVLRQAYRQPYREVFTDDASVVESAGNSITLVLGNEENIKITRPCDMAYAEAVLQANQLNN